eukprot:CAMPEP_0170183080 /NCGR_PEP_ID=MMETSP0040_2-20121228/29552_1 /TAXON_ID=641309 /ORGANISM="Lotharella oceanica, Strain CCMP622" /LENGTH=122 /DNA_ID=CAMNT_0010428699 /DNA_START=333 /DNA_END=698 /DNA_ORIENTATION=+
MTSTRHSRFQPLHPRPQRLPLDVINGNRRRPPSREDAAAEAAGGGRIGAGDGNVPAGEAEDCEDDVGVGTGLLQARAFLATGRFSLLHREPNVHQTSAQDQHISPGQYPRADAQRDHEQGGG